MRVRPGVERPVMRGHFREPLGTFSPGLRGGIQPAAGRGSRSRCSRGNRSGVAERDRGGGADVRHRDRTLTCPDSSRQSGRTVDRCRRTEPRLGSDSSSTDPLAVASLMTPARTAASVCRPAATSRLGQRVLPPSASSLVSEVMYTRPDWRGFLFPRSLPRRDSRCVGRSVAFG